MKILLMLMIGLVLFAPLTALIHSQELPTLLSSKSTQTLYRGNPVISKNEIITHLKSNYSPTYNGNTINFNSKAKFKDIYNSFDLSFSNSNWDIACTSDIYKNYLILNNSEKILAKGISATELLAVKDKISQLTILHRLLGNNFLTSLPFLTKTKASIIVYSNKKLKYDFDDYSVFLNLMNSYWNNRIVYFQITELKKNTNNRLEFWCSLFAVDHNNKVYDYADVRFHLNKRNQLDWIMWFIYPDLEI